MSPELEHRLLDALLRRHPWPWRIDQDWTWEVLAADHSVVLKCMTYAEARELCDFVEQRKKANDQAKLEVDALLQSAGIKP